MKRRRFLATIGISLSPIFGGCLGDDAPPGNVERENGTDGGSGQNESYEPNNSANETGVEERVTECERQYIEDEVVTSDDVTDYSVDPVVIEAEFRPEGEYVRLETAFGATRPVEDEPADHLDYFVIAYYFVSDDEVYRATDAEGDLRDGTVLDC